MFTYSRRRYAGFTVWELLAVIAVIIVIFTVLMPTMVSDGRARAPKNTCRNSMRQIGLALATYEEANKGFPSLYFRNRITDDGKIEPDDFEEDPTVASQQYSWIIKVLPYLEENNLYNQIQSRSKKFTTSPADVVLSKSDNSTVNAVNYDLPYVRCASTTNDYSQFAGTNYVALSATKQQLLTVGKGNQSLADGVFGPRAKGTSLGTVRDGVSKTLLLTESNEEQRANWYHWQQTFVCGFRPGDTSVQNNDPKTGVPRIEPGGKWIFNTTASDRTALMSGIPRDHLSAPYNASQTDPLRRILGPSSEHVGDVIVHINADASIREIISTNIDPKVYYSGITRDGQESYGFDEE